MSSEKQETTTTIDQQENLAELELQQREEMKNTFKNSIAEIFGVNPNNSELCDYVNRVMKKMKFQDGVLIANNEVFDVSGEIAGKMIKMSKFNTQTSQDPQSIPSDAELHRILATIVSGASNESYDADTKFHVYNKESVETSKMNAYAILAQPAAQEEPAAEPATLEAKPEDDLPIYEPEPINAYTAIAQTTNQVDNTLIDELRDYAISRNIRFTEGTNKITYDETNEQPKFLKYLDSDSEVCEQFQKVQMKKQLEQKLSEMLQVPINDKQLSDYVDIIVNSVEFNQDGILQPESEVHNDVGVVNKKQIVIKSFNENTMLRSQQIPEKASVHNVHMSIIQNALERQHIYNIDISLYTYDEKMMIQAQTRSVNSGLVDELRQYAIQRNVRFTENTNKITYKDEDNQPKFLKYLDADSEVCEQFQKIQMKKQLEEKLSEMLYVQIHDKQLSDYVDTIVNSMEFNENGILQPESEVYNDIGIINKKQVAIKSFNENIMLRSQQIDDRASINNVHISIIQNALERNKVYTMNIQFYTIQIETSQTQQSYEQIAIQNKLNNQQDDDIMLNSTSSQKQIQNYDYQFGQIHAYMRNVVGFDESEINLLLQYLTFDLDKQEFVFSYPQKLVTIGSQQPSTEGDQEVRFEVFREAHDYQHSYTFSYLYRTTAHKSALRPGVSSKQQLRRDNPLPHTSVIERTPAASWRVKTLRDEMSSSSGLQKSQRMAHTAPWRSEGYNTERKVQNIHELFEKKGINPVRKQNLKRPQFCSYMIAKTTTK